MTNWDKEYKVRKTYQTTQNMMLAIIGGAFVAGLLVMNCIIHC